MKYIVELEVFMMVSSLSTLFSLIVAFALKAQGDNVVAFFISSTITATLFVVCLITYLSLNNRYFKKIRNDIINNKSLERLKMILKYQENNDVDWGCSEDEALLYNKIIDNKLFRVQKLNRLDKNINNVIEDFISKAILELKMNKVCCKEYNQFQIGELLSNGYTTLKEMEYKVSIKEEILLDCWIIYQLEFLNTNKTSIIPKKHLDSLLIILDRVKSLENQNEELLNSETKLVNSEIDKFNDFVKILD